ncbi:E3 ubiquitin-protein ligase TRIM39 [Amia ocellicauda]|uniref:E3 ubiquitin-protein ligase TRIM39 n=1 Tax=Amia ocellicauda TaxID=2972642 RepID=UPI003463F339
MLSDSSIADMKKNNLWENVELKSVNPASMMKQPEPETSLPRSTEGPQKSSDGRVSLYKRISLLLACVWILTLISGLAVYFFFGSVDEQAFLRVRGRHSEQENSNAEITELRKQLQNKENEISNLQTNHSSLQQEFSDFSRDVKKIIEGCALSQRSNTELKKELQNKENEISNLQSRYSSLNASCDGLQRKQETLQTNHSNLLQEHSDLLRNHKNMTESNTELKKEVLDEKIEKSKLQSRYNSMKAGYLPIEMCFPNNRSKTVNGVLSEYSRKEGVALKPVWTWLHEAAVSITFNPNTAHASLIVSEDGKQIRLGDKRQNLTDSPERFDNVINVLGREGFTSGRHYWEVEVRKKISWFVGVARESVSRKGSVILTPKNGYWTVELRNRTEFKANADPSISLPLSLKPQRLGVYVDYEKGQVSFYNVEARTHIYTFTDTFTEKLYPFFCPGNHEYGNNPDPLTISPVS